MIQFYLEEVMPQAENHGPTDSVKQLGEKLHTLNQKFGECPRWFPCYYNTTPAVENVKSVFSKLQERGVYKAMSEFDIFINYIETYTTMK